MHQDPLFNDLADEGVTWFHDSSHVAPCLVSGTVLTRALIRISER